MAEAAGRAGARMTTSHRQHGSPSPPVCVCVCVCVCACACVCVCVRERERESTIHCRYLFKLVIVLVLGVALNLSGEPLGLADLLLRQLGKVELGRVHLKRRARAGLNACRAAKKQAPTVYL